MIADTMQRLMGRATNKAARRPVVPMFFSVDDDITKILDGLLGETPGWDPESECVASAADPSPVVGERASVPVQMRQRKTKKKVSSGYRRPGKGPLSAASWRQRQQQQQQQQKNPTPAAFALWILLASAWGAAMGAFGAGAGVWISAPPPRATVLLIQRREPSPPPLPPPVFAVSSSPPVHHRPILLPATTTTTTTACVGWATLSKTALMHVGRALVSPFTSFYTVLTKDRPSTKLGR